MRAGSLVSVVLIASCGPVELGDERVGDAGHDAALVLPPRDADLGPDPAPDPDPYPVQVRVAIEPEGCDGCASLTARASGGLGPYTYEWDDGSHESTRHVCPATLSAGVRVTARDARGTASVPHVTDLALPDASCPPPAPPLCLENASFEGKPAANIGFTPMFECPGWSACVAGGGANTPEVANETLSVITEIPKATDGETYLGLAENEQASQELCMGVAGGSVLALELDLRRLYIGGGVAPDPLPSLEIWGGVVPGCMARELLWASPPLSTQFKTYCVVLRPLQFTNRIVLRASSDSSPVAASYLLVDNLRPVSACR